MPHITTSVRDVVPTEEPESQGLSNTTKWIIVGAIIGVLLILSVVLYFIINRARAKKYRNTRRRDPNLNRNEFTRMRKLSNAERTAEEQETQRAVMIRKSLATRSTTSSMSSMMSRYSNIPHRDEEEADDIDPSDERPRSRGLREDWKEFEARINRERSNSGELHPCIAVKESGAGQGGITSPQSRTASPGQSPYLYPHPSPTSIPPQFPLHPPPGLHPALASMQHPSNRPERDSPHRMMPCLQPIRPAHIARV